MRLRFVDRLRRVTRWVGERTDELVLSGLAVVFFLVAANTQTGWLYLVSSILAALLWIGYRGPRSNLGKLEAEHTVPRAGQAGQPVTVRIRLRNASLRTRRHLVLIEPARPWQEEALERKFLVEELAPGASLSRTYVATPRARGAHQLPSVGLATAEPFGLFRATRALATGGVLLVHPSGPRLDRVLLTQSVRRRAYRERTFSRAGSSHDLRRVRSYAPGEDIRFIHWPSTARTGELMVREFRESGSVGLHLAIDNAVNAEFGEYPATSLEDEVCSAAALVEYGDRMGLRLHLAAYDGGPQWLANVRRNAVLDLLARITAEDPRSPVEWLEWLSRVVSGPGDLYVLTSRLLPVEAGTVLAGLGQVRTAVLYYPSCLYQPAQESLDAYRESRNRLELCGVTCRILPDRQRLSKFLEGRL
ncbi:MAG: DUF58 domain-containing protein [Armatimonadetes bacterium]|nr:DUF58 domain-containing protein [Armatimonadota bacterium]